MYCSKNLIRAVFTRCIAQSKYTQFTIEIIIPFVRHSRIASQYMCICSIFAFLTLSINDFSFYYLLMTDIIGRRLWYLRAIGHAIVRGYRIPVGVISRRRVRSIFGG